MAQRIMTLGAEYESAAVAALGLSMHVGSVSRLLLDAARRGGFGVGVLDTAGDAFSGVSAPIAALRSLVPAARHVFASELLSCRSCDTRGPCKDCAGGLFRSGILKKTHAHLIVYDGAGSAEAVAAPAVRFWSAGAPCSPFSTANVTATDGQRDAGVKLLFASLRYLDARAADARLPYVVLIENSSTLAEGGRYRKWGLKIMKRLRLIRGYDWQEARVRPESEGGVTARHRWFAVGALQPDHQW